MAEKLPNGVFQLTWKVKNNDNRITYNVYRSATEDFSTNQAENILAVGLREPRFKLYVPDNDEAFYYYVTVSDAFHNESEVSIPAFFYHSETIK